MDVTSRASLSASHPGNSCTAQNDQLIGKELVNAAANGNTRQVIRYVADHGVNILSTRHREAGNTTLHAAIKNSHVEVVGAITGLLVQPNPSRTINLRQLLDLKNQENHSPLEVGGITTTIKTELLACLSDRWPFCSAHKEYIVFPNQQECGCTTCELCSENIKYGGVYCTNCPEYLVGGSIMPDFSQIMSAKRDIRKYPVLFAGADLPACPNCNNLAFPPFVSQCGHVLCNTCVSKTGKTCQAKIADSDTFCQEPLKSIRIDEAASQRFIRLFSSQTQYGDCSALGQPIREAMNRPSTSAVLVEAPPSADVSTVSVETTVINGITTENCSHIPKRPDQPDRYAVPASDRIHKKYSEDVEENLKIEELEYRLEFSPDRIREKLERALNNARTQQEAEQKAAEQKAKEQRVIARPADDSEQLTPPDDAEQQEASGSSLECLLGELDARLATLSDPATAELETERTIAHAQQAAEQEAIAQDVAENPADSDIDILPLPDDDPAQQGASGSLLEILFREFDAISETVSDQPPAELEIERTIAHTQQEATEQGVAENAAESDIDIISLSDDEPVQQEVSASSLELPPPASFTMSDRLTERMTATLEPAATVAHTQQAAEQEEEAAEQQETRQHVIAQPTEDDEGTLALSYDFGQWLTSGRSWGMLHSESYAISETLPAPITATLETEPAYAQTQQEATEQHVIEQSIDDIETLALSDDADSLESSGRSWGTLSTESNTIPETLPDPITAMLGTAPAVVQTQQEAPEQHVIAQLADDIEPPALPDDADSLEASGRSWGILTPESNAIPETLPDPSTAMLETVPAVAQTQQEAPEQHVITQPADDIEPRALSADSDPLEAIDRWQPLLPTVTCEMSETLPGVSIASSIGGRPTMEDAHIATDFPIKAGGEDVPIKILGVFDGHGTKAVADHAAQYIVKFLTKRLEMYNTEGLTDEGIWNAIKIALVDLSRSYPHQDGGSTACVALIINNDLWIANLGDSRAILVNRNGEDIQLSEDAKPENEIYKHSIEKRGGYVGKALGTYRVNDNLAPARALADHHLDGAVCSRAKITRFDLTDFSVALCWSVTA